MGEPEPSAVAAKSAPGPAIRDRSQWRYAPRLGGTRQPLTGRPAEHRMRVSAIICRSRQEDDVIVHDLSPEAVRQILFGAIIVAVAAAYTRVTGEA